MCASRRGVAPAAWAWALSRQMSVVLFGLPLRPRCLSTQQAVLSSLGKAGFKAQTVWQGWQQRLFSRGASSAALPASASTCTMEVRRGSSRQRWRTLAAACTGGSPIDLRGQWPSMDRCSIPEHCLRRWPSHAAVGDLLLPPGAGCTHLLHRGRLFCATDIARIAAGRFLHARYHGS
jgi:hypothetical protein